MVLTKLRQLWIQNQMVNDSDSKNVKIGHQLVSNSKSDDELSWDESDILCFIFRWNVPFSTKQHNFGFIFDMIHSHWQLKKKWFRAVTHYSTFLCFQVFASFLWSGVFPVFRFFSTKVSTVKKCENTKTRKKWCSV